MEGEAELCVPETEATILSTLSTITKPLAPPRVAMPAELEIIKTN
jgi:hypothetical protein